MGVVSSVGIGLAMTRMRKILLVRKSRRGV